MTVVAICLHAQEIYGIYKDKNKLQNYRECPETLTLVSVQPCVNKSDCN